MRKPAREEEAAGGEPVAAAARERGGIQSLERAFAILEDVARHRDGINLADLSRRVGLHTSTTFHLVKTLASLGYVRQVTDSKRYRIGTRLFTLAAGALDENELLALATPILEKLTSETGECGHFAIRSGDEVVVVARTAGSGMLQLADRAGAIRPPHATALGKVLLAALPPGQLDHFLAGTALRRFTAKTIVERAALRREIAHVRDRGIAFDDGEFDAEVRCVAVPVHDFAGRVAGAIGISGPIWRLSLPSLQDKAKQVRERAAELSAALGFREHARAVAR
jgi:DNA-binding IclR family transcriptional regulator